MLLCYVIDHACALAIPLPWSCGCSARSTAVYAVRTVGVRMVNNVSAVSRTMHVHCP